MLAKFLKNFQNSLLWSQSDFKSCVKSYNCRYMTRGNKNTLKRENSSCKSALLKVNISSGHEELYFVYFDCVFTRQKITPECAVPRCRGLHPLWEVPFFRQEFSVYQLCLKSELCSLTGNNTNIHSCIKNVIQFTTVAMVTCILSLPDACVIPFFFFFWKYHYRVI